MKNAIIILLVSLVFLNACEEDIIISVEEQLAIDIEKIEDYLVDKGLTALSTESGLHYIIEEQGAGNYPTIDSIVEVNYRGTFLNGYEFSSGTIEGNVAFYIRGWQEGIPLFKEGGKGMLLIPSKLGYGSNDYASIPGNSILIFEIELLEVKGELNDLY